MPYLYLVPSRLIISVTFRSISITQILSRDEAEFKVHKNLRFVLKILPGTMLTELNKQTVKIHDK